MSEERQRHDPEERRIEREERERAFAAEDAFCEKQGRDLLESHVFREWLSGLMLELGYVGGVPWHTGDYKSDCFNSGRLSVAKTILRRLGTANRADACKAIFDNAIGRIKAKGK